MLIRFIGSPGSGKTTVAAKVFAHLKEDSYPCDFITEYARRYISEKRRSAGWSGKISLTDLDQEQIFDGQVGLDLAFCGVNWDRVGDNHWNISNEDHEKSMIITDTSPLNALFYMSESYIDQNLAYWLEIKIGLVLAMPSLYFYSPPIVDLSVSDSNRVHSREQSLEVDRKIPLILKKYVPNLKIIPLFGSSDQRTKQVLTEIYSYDNHR